MPSFDLSAVLEIPELKSNLEAVNDVLANAISKDNEFIYDPYNRIMQSKSKRLRPSLVIAIASVQRPPSESDVITSAAAVEMVHIASLIHDDIIDHASVRHGLNTINSQEGLAQAIIIGDYLLAKAGETAAMVNAEIAITLQTAITRLCAGQAREVSDNYNIDRSLTSYLDAISGKTAALFSCSCRIGGLLNGRDEAELEYLSQFGENFGMAFQLIDDLLDFISSEELFGKPVGNDIAEGVYTLPILLALGARQPTKIRQLLIPKTNINLGQLNTILFSSGSIAKTIAEIEKYNSLAVESLDIFGKGNQTISNLCRLPHDYFSWAINNMVDMPYKQQVFDLLSNT